MGREIRMVAPNWKHPKQKCRHSPWAGGCSEAKRSGGECYVPLMEGYADRKAEFEEMQREKGLQEAIDYFGRAPDANDYVPDWKEGEATWFQVYETVSEGTPVTPAFATKEELIDYLVANGDYWSQLRGEGGCSRDAAERFVSSGFALSMIISDGVIRQGIECA